MILLVLVLLFWPCLSTATTYYVSPFGDDTTGDGSIENPWFTPQKAVNSVTAGDEILVDTGTYADLDNSGRTVLISSTSPSGTSTNPITLRGEPCHGAVIEAPVIGGSMVAILVNRPYWIIECFEITGNELSGSQPAGTGVIGIFLESGATGAIVRNNKIHDIGRQICSDSVVGFSGIFTRGASSQLLTGNEIYRVGRLFNGESGCSTTLNANDHAFYVETANNTTITRNISYDNARGYCLNVFRSGQPSTYVHTNLTFEHNTCDTPAGETRGPAGQIIYGQSHTGLKIRNNIFSRPETCVLQTFSVGTFTSTSIVGNRTDVNDTNFHCSSPPTGVTVDATNVANASLGLADRDGGQYTLAAGSASIDAGVNIGGAFNGSAPDAGAYETFTFASCEITAANTIRVTFTNNVDAPLLPEFDALTFTARKNGAANTVSGQVDRVGDNIFEMTTTNAYAGGNTGDISWSTGNITSSSGQPLLQTLTNQSCTNSVGAVPYTFTQTTYRFHGIYGSESAPDIRSAEGVSVFPVVKGGAVRLRLALVCGVQDCADSAFYLYYSTGGAYAPVPDNYDAGNVAFCRNTFSNGVHPENGSATTNQLSTPGTFTPGGVVYSANAIPTVVGFNTDYKTELEYCVRFHASASGTYTFRLYKQDGTALDTYALTPNVSVIAAQASGGF